MRTMQKNAASVPFVGTVGFARRDSAKSGVAARAKPSQAVDADRVAGIAQASALVHSPAKRVFDFAAASLALVLLLPGLVAIATTIKATSRGPILFCQRRYGLNNKLFVIYKFRTMYVDKGDETGVTQTCSADERITPIGRILRRYSIDELPQLINIVKGDMSLVGPRPHVPGMLGGGVPYEVLVPNYFERHRVRPGLTGLAQARGLRGSTVDPTLAIARIDEDLKYIRTWSFGRDLRIIAATAWMELYKWGNGI